MWGDADSGVGERGGGLQSCRMPSALVPAVMYYIWVEPMKSGLDGRTITDG
jgi:hypothetical protein